MAHDTSKMRIFKVVQSEMENNVRLEVATYLWNVNRKIAYLKSKYQGNIYLKKIFLEKKQTTWNT